MIKSMTAFSQVSNTHDTVTVDVTIRSYNSRHLDMAFYCPESCQVFEDDIKKMIAKIHDRGRIEIRLSVQDDAKDLEQFEVDEAKAVSYFQALKKIKDTLNLSSDISVQDILTARNVIVPFKKEQDSQNLWKAIKPTIEQAGNQLDLMRKKEGKNLYVDLCTRMDYIEKNLKQIETDAKEIPLIYKKKLMDRISFLTTDTEELDPVRISQEAAIIADKSDVSEEIVRLYSHIKQFREILDSEGSEGRKLNFLIQEFNREFNTIGSKAGSASLSHAVVDLKSELEKIREQVQNIE
ncbi:MAG: YicC family protein [Proteobacteria bacterium]|nr:YicC family protein [Pseudomonadota bacterium]MBU1582302.1 YicC family protein [Pseudomonadota bacterium]MBU2452709.1 YicC family protein [Pseudomonadota bacterium]MBU2627164.1 YicC family protein [Pseudomonadota bacterium]